MKNFHFFHGNIWTHNWPIPNVSGYIAQLIKHRTGIARSRVETPLKSWIFFQVSLRNCINCVHCDDHFFIFKPSFVISNFKNVKIILWCSSKNIFTDPLSESCLKTKQKTPTAFKKGTTCSVIISSVNSKVALLSLSQLASLLWSYNSTTTGLMMSLGKLRLLQTALQGKSIRSDLFRA